MMNKEYGYCAGEVCNRNGCKGIIVEGEKEGSCTCHICPPCTYCTTQTEYCPECGWHAESAEAYHEEYYTPLNGKSLKYKHTYPAPLSVYERFNLLKDNEFGYIYTYTDNIVVRMKGKHPNMTGKEILEKLGLQENPEIPRFKFLNEKEFELSYFID